MIEVNIYRQTDERIIGFRVSGHAHYDDPGKDIVCAAVSAVTVGAVNAVESLAGVVSETVMEPGLLHVQLPSIAAAGTAEKTQTILETMEQMLLSIADSYGEFVQIVNAVIE